ncbi:MAG TPA: RHS repeat-associated core domain-containing protein, partial [Tepidisphaeraceae bacterium]|nr:RHS repeat-associated core domain-containing protein [Tepidisphaeraceae bacterium]
DNFYDTQAAPAVPVLGQATGGTGSTTGLYFVKVTYIIGGGETAASVEGWYSVGSAGVLTVALNGSAPSGASGYNVYVGTVSGGELLQNSTPVAVGGTWTEPTTGLVTGTAAVPTSGVGDGNLTQVVEHTGLILGSVAVRSPDRWTETAYNWRDEAALSKEGVESAEDTTTYRPILQNVYDNLGEVVEQDRFSADTVELQSLGSTNGVPNAPASGLVAKQTTAFDDQHRVYQLKVHSVVAGVAGAALTTNMFYDSRGNEVATWDPAGLWSKDVVDGAGRVVSQYSTDGGAVNDPTGLGSYTAAMGIANDVVLSETDNSYDPNGNTILVTSKERFHNDASSATGALGSPTAGVGARDSFVAGYFDADNRPTASVDVGTNGGSAYTRPATVPARSDTVLVTSLGYLADNMQAVTIAGGPTGGTFTLSFGSATTSALPYNASAATVESALDALTGIGAGNVAVVGGTGGPYTIRFMGTLAGTNQPQLTANGAVLTGGTSPSVGVLTLVPGGDSGAQQSSQDPRGIITKADLDMLGRKFDSVFAFSTGVPSANTDQTTGFAYDGDNHVLLMTAVMPAGTPSQQTQYIYATSPSNGSKLSSNDLLSTIEYPDPTTGAPSTASTNQVTDVYDIQGEVYDSVMFYYNGDGFRYDVLDQLTRSTIVPEGRGDVTVRNLTYTFNPQGLLYQATTNQAFSGGDPLNQVQDEYNGLGELTTQYQELNGVVNTSTSAKVQYAYSDPTTGSRLMTITYPNQRILHYGYDNNPVDNAIGRVDYQADDNGSGGVGSHLADYSYLGLSTIVDQADANGVSLSAIHQTGDTLSSSDGGDQYTGLDRFGRNIDQNWLNTSTGVSTDRFQYGFDTSSNVLYKNIVGLGATAAGFSELYHTNSTASGDNSTAYDDLSRLQAFARGTLSASGHNGSSLDTVTVSTASQSWSLDPLGNWSSVTDSATNPSPTPQTRSVNAQNEITNITGNTLSTGTTAVTPTYDVFGNMTVDDAGDHLTYNGWNQLTQVKDPTNTTTLATYQYNALGERVTVNEGGTTTDLYYSTNSQVLEEKVGSTTTKQYVWGLGYGNNLLLRDDNSITGNLGISGSGLGNRLFVQHDANYNTTALVDASGTVKERFIYTPYGVQSVLTAGWASGSDSQNWSYYFQGGRYDGVTGLIHFDNRDYSPSLGTWIERDPARYRDSINLYQFERGMPAEGLDPTGLGLLKLIYTGDSNASDQEYSAAVNGAGDWLDQFSPVRGGYAEIVAEDQSKLGGGRSIVAEAGGGGAWTIDDGGYWYGQAGVGYSGKNGGGAGLGVGYYHTFQSNKCGGSGGWFWGPVGYSGGAHAAASGGQIYLGLHEGPVAAGLIVDPTRFANPEYWNGNADALKSIWKWATCR